ncbi:hypothetical protein B621_gp19 [Marinomonas phage P12026]|jgi:hypothetical protein|uniref:hypothetical protein n=1 Tax=Marinomonas phage P12026 TaxID=1176423 RepID=UPI0002688F3D|nr:hypothetical protein B621_gp19 [Marinomonas phage P12026]AFM54865.1 hypothetical protein P12026_19 [Marinomonas phage P12026]
MADWTDIPDENLSPNAPARSADMLAMRDNITAQAEGAAGAPKTQTAAIEDLSVTNAKLSADAVTADKLAPDAARLNNADTRAGEVGSYAMLNYSGGTTIPGTVRSGNLFYASAGSETYSAASGSWRCMGYTRSGTANPSDKTTLWLRIS